MKWIACRVLTLHYLCFNLLLPKMRLGRSQDCQNAASMQPEYDQNAARMQPHIPRTYLRTSNRNTIATQSEAAPPTTAAITAARTESQYCKSTSVNQMDRMPCSNLALPLFQPLATKMRLGCSQNAARMPPEFSQNAAAHQPHINRT